MSAIGPKKYFARKEMKWFDHKMPARVLNALVYVPSIFQDVFFSFVFLCLVNVTHYLVCAVLFLFLLVKIKDGTSRTHIKNDKYFVKIERIQEYF